jgi:predicted RND superfamily exporter protein
MALLARSLTLLTGLLGPMLLALGSIYGVHVLARYGEEAATSTDGPAAALRCLCHTRVPVTIAGLTTVIGFGALLITDVPAVFELGSFSMLGIGAITVVSLTGAPALLGMLPLRASPRARTAIYIGRLLDDLLARLAGRVGRSPRRILMGWLVAAAVAALAIPWIVIDTDYLSYFDERDPVRRDFEAVNRLLAGAVPLYVVFEGAGAGSFREPAVLTAIEDLQQRLSRIEGVSRALSFLEPMRALNRAFHADDPAHEEIPDTRPGVTELLFMIPKYELRRFTTVDHSRGNVIVRTGEVGSAAIMRLRSAIEAELEATALPEGFSAGVTGNAVLLARSADGIASGQPLSVGLAAVAIFVLLCAGLRSPGIGIVAMVPNLLPVLIFFGLLGLGVAPLSLPTSLIGCAALGIAIDDTVHFLVRYRAERRLGAGPQQAAVRCSRFVGRPICITSVMLSLGFLVVAFSEFATLREFGVLSAVTMVVCLVTDLILLPAMLVRFRL